MYLLSTHGLWGLKTFLDCQTAMYINFDKIYIHLDIYIYLLYKWGFSPSLKYNFPYIYTKIAYIFLGAPVAPPFRAIPYRRFSLIQTLRWSTSPPRRSFQERCARFMAAATNMWWVEGGPWMLLWLVKRKTPWWMIYNGKFIKMDDLGVPLFLETSNSIEVVATHFFLFSPRNLGKMKPFWLIFLRWVETTN